MTNRRGGADVRYGPGPGSGSCGGGGVALELGGQNGAGSRQGSVGSWNGGVVAGGVVAGTVVVGVGGTVVLGVGVYVAVGGSCTRVRGTQV